tara:strand:+ start:528 stop:779 length:252 start_codon:yes stop_codon:yes gene_type:complete
MKVNSTNESANALLDLLNTYDKTIDITELSTIVGSSCDIISIISSDKFVGFNTIDLVVTDLIDSDTLSILQANTTGTIEQVGE